MTTDTNSDVIIIGVKFTDCVFCLAEANPKQTFTILSNNDKTCQEHLDRCSQGRYCICCAAESQYFHSDVSIGYETIDCSRCGLKFDSWFDQEWPEKNGLTLPDDFNAIYDDPQFAQGWKTTIKYHGVRKLSSGKS